jgi:serine protease
VTQADLNSGAFPNCEVASSSWHGTRVAGLVGARTNNSAGIAAGTWSSWILPVRVLGKCGGFDSDIIAAMSGAAGLPVADTPPTTHPARVLNLSLGSAATSCPQSYRNIVDALALRKVLVVASAGNTGGPVGAPGNCPGVLAVTGLRHAGTKVGFSSLGREIAIGAPGGNCVNVFAGQPCLYSLDTTYNTGTTVPGAHSYTNQISANYGTSFAAPIVSAIAGLMLAANGNLAPAQVIARVREGAKTPFPQPAASTGIPQCHVPNPNNPLDLQVTECACTTETCGAGMANAPGAVAAAQRPIAAIAVPTAVSPGQPVTVSGVGSAAACGRSVAQHEWTVVSGMAAPSSPNTPTTTVVAPALGSFTLRLTVTDDAGRQDAADVTYPPTSAVTIAPAEAGTSACLPEVSPIGVVVTPQTVTLLVDGSVNFNTSVAGAADGTVTWEVNGIAGGDATVGTISSDGLYSAPVAVPTPPTVTVTAVANADSRATASAQVTIIAPAPPPPPANSGGTAPSNGGGGGAGADLLALLFVLAGGAALLPQRRRVPHAGRFPRRSRRECR